MGILSILRPFHHDPISSATIPPSCAITNGLWAWFRVDYITATPSNPAYGKVCEHTIQALGCNLMYYLGIIVESTF